MKQLLSEHSPQLVFIAETLLSFDNASSLLHKWGFERSCGTSVEGKKGGTILAWKGSVRCQVLDISPHWIHASVVDGAGIEFNLTCVYGPPHLPARAPFWQKLTTFSQETQLPWLLLGDFNQVLCHSEKLSVNCKIPGVEDFENFLHDACLVNLHPQGNWFTWTNGRVGEGAVWERLDRALCNVAWLTVYPQTSVFCLPIYTSDHSPFVVLLHDVVPRRPRPSRFEAMWLLDDSCKQVVSHAWNINISGSSAYLFVSKCRNVMSQLKRWNREVFGHIPSKFSDLQRHIKAVQEQVGESIQDDTLLATEAALRNELEKLLDKEELLWAQKSRQMWLLQGDRNTKYFHTLVKKRRINNRISRIKLDSGEWTQSYNAMEGVVLDYFSHVYSMNHDTPVMDIYHSLEHLNIPRLTNQEQDGLLSPVTQKEVESALFKMKSDKAPGPDGLPPLFFQSFWPLIQNDLVRLVQSFFSRAGQQLNYDKSFLVFSPNTSRTVKDRIASRLGVAVSNKIGRYLGSFVDNKLSDPQNYNVLVERIGSKLAGWKAKTLSQAGRLTLIKSVLQPLNIYHMSTLAIPRKYYHQMDAICSNFFWGFRGEKPAMHLLNKRKIFAPQDRGGLGLRYAELVNVALVTKQDQVSLDVVVLPKPGYLSLIKGRFLHYSEAIVSRDVLHLLQSQNILLRLPDAELLQQLCDLECIMPQYVFSGPEVFASIEPIHPPCRQAGKDKIAWNHSSNGKFSLKTAYNNIITRTTNDAKDPWKQIWKCPTLERVKVFLWPLGHDSIMTNVQRKKRGFCTSDICQLCGTEAETSTHALRDCPEVKEV
ncbi:reverse transcriptase [Senna tora]|uniref:Reverse transcriptase n=1 Tax=Senna tora TaxID=362788 RepID=A0A834SPN7_9FABA|nr:reverse transcriptase [Senna tora]